MGSITLLFHCLGFCYYIIQHCTCLMDIMGQGLLNLNGGANVTRPFVTPLVVAIWLSSSGPPFLLASMVGATNASWNMSSHRQSSSMTAPFGNYIRCGLQTYSHSSSELSFSPSPFQTRICGFWPWWMKLSSTVESFVPRQTPYNEHMDTWCESIHIFLPIVAPYATTCHLFVFVSIDCL